MNPITINRKEPLRGSTTQSHGFAQANYSTDNSPVDSMLGLSQILAFMPRRHPLGALDTHLLLYPLNVLRLTEAFIQAVMLLPKQFVLTDPDACDTWSGLFAMPCSLVKTNHGDYRVRVAWKILAKEAPDRCSLNCSYLIRQWAKVIKQLQRGQSCPLLGLRSATEVGIRLSASQDVNKLIQELPDLLDELSKGRAGIAGELGNLPDAMLAFCNGIRIALKDAACAPLYEELSEFELSSEEVDLAFAVAV